MFFSSLCISTFSTRYERYETKDWGPEKEVEMRRGRKKRDEEWRRKREKREIEGRGKGGHMRAEKGNGEDGRIFLNLHFLNRHFLNRHFLNKHFLH